MAKYMTNEGNNRDGINCFKTRLKFSDEIMKIYIFYNEDDTGTAGIIKQYDRSSSGGTLRQKFNLNDLWHLPFDILLAPQSGALRINAYRDFHPIPTLPLIAFKHLSLSMVI